MVFNVRVSRDLVTKLSNMTFATQHSRTGIICRLIDYADDLFIQNVIAFAIAISGEKLFSTSFDVKEVGINE